MKTIVNIILKKDLFFSLPAFLFVSIALFSFASDAEKTNSDLKDLYHTFQEQTLEKSFVTSLGHKVYWVVVKAKKSIGTIVISPGRSESRLSYYELALSFQTAGYNVVIFEHKGQGKSFRYQNKSDAGHIENFNEYVDDFSALNTQVRDFLDGPYYLYATSMGAAISLLQPNVANSFAKIVLASPMFEIRTKGVPFFIAELALNLKEFFYSSSEYAPFVGAFDPSCSFEKNEYAKSKSRFDANIEIYKNNPEMLVGGPSINWVRTALTVTRPLEKAVTEVTAPVLIFQADDERFVNSQKQKDFCSLMEKCQIQVLENSFHALHLDTDANVEKLIRQTIEFFK